MVLWPPYWKWRKTFQLHCGLHGPIMCIHRMISRWRNTLQFHYRLHWQILCVHRIVSIGCANRSRLFIQRMRRCNHFVGGHIGIESSSVSGCIVITFCIRPLFRFGRVEDWLRFFHLSARPTFCWAVVKVLGWDERPVPVFLFLFDFPMSSIRSSV